MADGLTIGEVARRAGVRPSAIRYYEGAGLLPRPPRASGQRRYADSVLDRLGVLHLARRSGFTIAEMRTLVAGFEDKGPPPERWRALARRKLAELDDLIARTEKMKELLQQSLACGCIRLEDCARILADVAPQAPPLPRGAGRNGATK